MRLKLTMAGLALLMMITGCATTPGTPAERSDDEIIVAGERFHTGTRVVLWTDPQGYDAYREAQWFEQSDTEGETSADDDSPNHYSVRTADYWSDDQVARFRRGSWTLDELRRVVDKFVIHYDVAGTSRRAFDVLQKRGLSAHFLLDLDGTIYQTMDLKEAAWHASHANDQAIGVEIANMGAWQRDSNHPLDDWYERDETGKLRVTIPPHRGDGGLLRPDQVLRPARHEPIYGSINGNELIQYDFTPQQYEALVKLTAALTRIFPKLELQYPTNDEGELLTAHPLTPEETDNFQGIIGHHQFEQNKVDPGPAFQWDDFMRRVRDAR